MLPLAARAEEPRVADQPAEVRVRPRVMPSDGPLPAEAFAGNAYAVCVVRVSIDTRGVPYEVTAVTCDEPMFALGQDIAMRTRFYPAKDGGKRVKARFDYTIKFKNPHPVNEPAEQGTLPP